MASGRLPILNTAAPLLEGEDGGGSSWIGTISVYFLSFIQTFDELTDAPSWSQSSRYIAITSAVTLAIILKLSKRNYNVNWCSYAHAFATGGLSFICVWLNVFAAEPLTGMTEPLGSVLCKGPLTTIHSIIPAITMGFGVFDLIEGIGMGKLDFILHGVATFLVMAYFCEVGVPEIIVPMLLMELSTLNLVFMGASFMTHASMFVNIGIFSVNFLIYRLIVCPYLWWGIFTATWDNRYNPESQACLPWHFTYVTFFFGMFFNCLNLFWWHKIMRKLYYKLTGIEDLKVLNTAKDS